MLGTRRLARNIESNKKVCVVKSFDLHSPAGFAGDGRGLGRRFENMSMIGCAGNFARFSLLTFFDVLDPFVIQDFIESGPTVHVHFEHPADNIPAFARENA